MKKVYENLFKELVKAYYNDNFDEKINFIINEHNFDNKEAMDVISSLCGVTVDKDDNYIYNLKKAITNYEVNRKVVERVRDCSEHCSTDDDGKSPCQLSCPFNAILSDPIKGTKHIEENLCMDCGLCVEACENGKFLDKVEFMPIVDLLKNNKKVIAAVAPAIAGQFGKDISLEQLREAFIKVGFSDMVEVAFAADMLTIKEAVEFDHHVSKKGDIMITSCCCPMWVGMLRKVYDQLVKDVSPSVSPMIAMGRLLKKLNPDVKVVFIGPCIAKKAEAKEKDLAGIIDFVLTFQEVKGIFDILEITPSSYKGIPSAEYASRGGRLYARTAGVSTAVSEAIEELFPEKHKILKAVQAHGIKECKEMLAKAQTGEIDGNFIEGMGCVGGCVGGPKILIPREEGREAANKVAYDSSIKVATHSNIMDDVLSKIGINSLEDFKDREKIEIFEREF